MVPRESHVDQGGGDGVIGARAVFFLQGRESLDDLFVEAAQCGGADGRVIVIVVLFPFSLLVIPVEEGAAFFRWRGVGGKYHQIVAHAGEWVREVIRILR